MKIHMKNVVVFVHDLAKAKAFYTDALGIPLVGETQMNLEFFPGEKTTLGVSLAIQDEARKLVGRHTGITLQVTDLEKLCERLKEKNVQFVEELEASPWGKMAVVADPDGNQLALVELPGAK